VLSEDWRFFVCTLSKRNHLRGEGFDRVRPCRLNSGNKAPSLLPPALDPAASRARPFLPSGIKSAASKAELTEYLGRLKETTHYEKMFFVWHTGEVGEVPEADKANVLLIGPIPLARMALEAGLASWLQDKVS